MVYHRDTGFPKSLIIEEFEANLILSNHAIERILGNLYIVNLPERIKIKKEDIVEITTLDKVNIQKMLIRIPNTSRTDYVMSIKPFFETKTALLITIWLNFKQDTHITLDKTKYDLP
jgi:hypothetical protein